MHERVGAVGLEAELREFLRDEVRDRRDHRGRRLRHAVRADGGDADRSLVPAVGMSALGVVAALAARPHVAVLVDKVAVADIAPAARDRVVVVDRADGGGDLPVTAVVGDGVVDDGLLHLLRVARDPLHELVVSCPILPREDARRIDRGRAGRRRLGERSRDVLRGADDVVHQAHDRTRVQIVHVHEGEADTLHVGGIPVGEPHAVLRIARVVHREMRRGVPLVRVHIGHVLIRAEEVPVAPARAVRRGAELDVEAVLSPARGDPVHADAVEKLTRCDGR